MRRVLCALLAAGGLAAAEVPAAEPAAAPAQPGPFAGGKPAGKLLSGNDGAVFVIAPDGQVAWKHASHGFVTDASFLPNGNILYSADSHAAEVTPDQRIVFQYDLAERAGGGIYSCQRLANGNTLVAENSTGRLREIAPDGKTVVFELKLPDMTPGQHYNMRVARKLANGNYLVAHTGRRMAREYAPDGRIVWEQTAPDGAEHLFVAIRQPDGHTLLSTYRAIYEYTADHRLVWTFAREDFPPGKHLGVFCGLQLLPNGHLVVAVYQTYDQAGNGVGLFEIDRKKRVVWSYASPATSPINPTVHLLVAGRPRGADPTR